jgi:hypothetical protein
MVDKKIKYVLSDFMLDGGKGKRHKTRTQYGKSKDFGWSKGTGKQKKISRSFGEPPENVDPNGQSDKFSIQELERFQNKIRQHQIEVQDWGNLDPYKGRPGAIGDIYENNPERITHLSKRAQLSRRRKK